MNMYEDAGRLSKETVDNTLKSFSAVTRGLQQIATETADFTKRSYEQSTQMFEQLVQSKSFDKAIEVQNDYAKSAYQSWVSQATKMGEIYAEIAKETYRPFETASLRVAETGSQTVKKAA